MATAAAAAAAAALPRGGRATAAPAPTRRPLQKKNLRAGHPEKEKSKKTLIFEELRPNGRQNRVLREKLRI